MSEVATMEEWRAFIRSDGFWTAPEFLAQKFWLKTGKLPPHGSGINMVAALQAKHHFTPVDTLGDEEE